MIYFLSDAHLGSRAIPHGRTHERRLVRFLDDIKDRAEAIYLMGDMFDFWFEYSDVVPKGYTRFLGKISELTDRGIEVHLFTGNHDMWVGDYLTAECGIQIHHDSCVVDIVDKTFFLSHGHLIDMRDKGFATRLMFWCFRNKALQRLARMVHPHFFINFGLNWARHSHIHHHLKTQKPKPMTHSPKTEPLQLFAENYLQHHPDINYFIFGHRHINLDIPLLPPTSSLLPATCGKAAPLPASNTRLIILGEWYSMFTYAAFDGNELKISNYVEGEPTL